MHTVHFPTFSIMFKINYFIILVLLFFVSSAIGELTFNNLQERLILVIIFLKLLEVAPKNNIVASALLSRFPLCKLASVATGDAKQELMTALGYKDEDGLSNCFTGLKRNLKEMLTSDLLIVNRIFINYTDDIDPTFMTNNGEKYGVKVEKVGFNYPRSAISFINNRVASGTYRRITDIVDAKDINENTMMAIVTGAHFKGTFEFPFDIRLTKQLQFQHYDGRTSRVPMMTRTDSFSYMAANDLKMLSIKFGSWKLSLTIVLPNDRRGLPTLFQKMNEQPSYINSLFKEMRATPLRVLLPRLKIKTFLDWTGFYQELGLYSIFNNETSDLQGILKKDSKIKNIHLNTVKQKLFIQIDEMGAGRFTRDPQMRHGIPDIPPYGSVPEFNANKPFYFQISWEQDMNNQLVLFAGMYTGPEPEPHQT